MLIGLSALTSQTLPQQETAFLPCRVGLLTETSLLNRIQVQREQYLQPAPHRGNSSSIGCSRGAPPFGSSMRLGPIAAFAPGCYAHFDFCSLQLFPRLCWIPSSPGGDRQTEWITVTGAVLGKSSAKRLSKVRNSVYASWFSTCTNLIVTRTYCLSILSTVGQYAKSRKPSSAGTLITHYNALARSASYCTRRQFYLLV